jgi:thymidylate kinase
MVLVVIDGLDASGKSTQAIALCDFLRGKRGKTVLVRFHPSSDSFFGARANVFSMKVGRMLISRRRFFTCLTSFVLSCCTRGESTIM